MPDEVVLPRSPGEIQWGESLLPDTSAPELEAKLKRMFGGIVPNVFRKIAGVPWLVELWLSLMRRRHSVVPRELADVAGLVATQENGCRYCYGGERATVRLLGFSQARLRALEMRMELERLAFLERAVVEWTATVTRAKRRPSAEERAALERGGLGALEIAELTAHVAIVCACSRVSTLIACPPDVDYERMPDSLVFGRILRPVLARFMRPERLPERSVSPDPFAPLIEPLGQTWGAQIFRGSIDGLLGSGPVPARTKLLAMLVVAHALDSAAVRDECTRLLEGHGIPRAVAEEVTRHLESKALDPLEAKLLPLARESVRYKPLAIQARVRDVTAGMDTRSTLDVVGALALGNGLARLGALVS